ncbi:uncharacterized protein [Panulirus ornatus]|uniref:uncharacterized protein isoform X2 n=1 Tax=Panulirus ornatus TaxID=150431 RepID=UPI003A8708D8
MGRHTGVRGVTGWTATTIGEAAGAARFLSHVPHDYLPDDVLDSADDADYDADVKLPGRHYPKLPYDLDDSSGLVFGDPNYLHPYHNPHDPSYGPQSGTTSYDYDDFDKESSYEDYYREVGDGEEGRHLVSPQSDTAGGPAGPPPGPLPGNPPGPPPVPDTSPRFDRSQPRSITVQAGKTAVLVCRVLNIGDKSVSWMRHEDLHILTVDKYKYSTDGRVSIVYNEAEQEWLLKIKGVRQTDAGRYECQVSTKPVLSFIVNLDVVDELPPTTPYPKLRDEQEPADAPRIEPQVPSATILNGPEIHVHRGSLINLTCIVDHTTERPLYIVWYHYNKVIDYDEMGGVVIVTQSGQNTVSHLLVKNAEPSDSGKYTCRPSNGEDASVMLHVLNGEHPAAMQTNTGVTSARAPQPGHLVAALCLTLATRLFLRRC